MNKSQFSASEPIEINHFLHRLMIQIIFQTPFFQYKYSIVGAKLAATHLLASAIDRHYSATRQKKPGRYVVPLPSSYPDFLGNPENKGDWKQSNHIFPIRYFSPCEVWQRDQNLSMRCQKRPFYPKMEIY